MRTIRSKFLVFPVLLATIPLITLGFISFQDSSKALRETTRQQLRQIVQDAHQDIDSHLLDRLNTVQLLSESQALAIFSRLGMDKHIFDTEIYNFQRWNGLKLDPFPSVGDLVNFGVGLGDFGGKKVLDFGLYPSEEYIGPDGMVRQHVYAGGSNDQDFQGARSEKLDRSQEIWFQEAKKGSYYISRPQNIKLYLQEYRLAQVGVIERAVEKKLMVIAVPHRVNREIRGVLAVTTTPDILRKKLAELTFNYGMAFLVDGQGGIIAHQDPDKEGQKIEAGLLNLLNAPDKGWKSYQGDLITYYRSRLTGWILLLQIPEEGVLQPIYGMRFKPVIVVGITVLVTGFLMIWVTNRFIINPIRALSKGSEIIAQGDYSHRLQIRTGDEIEQLALVLNTLAERVQTHTENLEMRVEERTQELQKKNRQLEETLEQLKIAQNQLIQSEKMGSLGQMLSGVAHELNNPLTAIKMFTELLKLDLVSDESAIEKLRKIDQATDRAKKIIQNLLTIARRHKPEKRYIQINQVLEEVLDLRAYNLRLNNIEMVKDLQENLPKTMADFHQLQQVFLNILLNAEQAMQEAHRQGRLIIRSRLIETVRDLPLQKTSALSHGEEVLHPPLPFIRVTITDEGPGIPPENLRRIFDPFFTTKEVGKGTGLGLSISYTLIQEHEGRIYAASEVGKGTTLLVELPVKAEEEKPLGIKSHGDPASALQGGSPRKQVLVIDDESIIVNVVSEILEKLGYAVDCAENVKTALENLNLKTYDILLTDIKMPQMGGKEFYEYVKQQNPKLARQIIFMTGDMLSEDTLKFIRESGNLCLAKPFNTDELQKALEQLE